MPYKASLYKQLTHTDIIQVDAENDRVWMKKIKFDDNSELSSAANIIQVATPNTSQTRVLKYNGTTGNLEWGIIDGLDSASYRVIWWTVLSNGDTLKIATSNVVGGTLNDMDFLTWDTTKFNETLNGTG